MIIEEPSSLEVFITVTAGNLFGGFWKEYVDRMDLKGNERVLELGPSAGNNSRHLARRLVKGGGCLTAVDISAVWVEVARKRLRKFPNVELKLGDISQLDIPDRSQDAVLLSFVIHDIPRAERQGIVNATLAKLAPGGKLFVREPLRNITPQEIRHMLQMNGLIEASSSVAEIKTQGQVFEGVYLKPT